MSRLFILILTASLSGQTFASSGLGDSMYRFIKEELFSAATSESVGLFGSLDNLIKKNEVRFIDRNKGTPVLFTDTGKYDLGLYIPNMGSLYFYNTDQLLRLPPGYVAFTFRDKKGNVSPYRFISLPNVHTPVLVSATPAVTNEQKNSKKFPLKIVTYPNDATVRIMNIGPKYRDGMILKDGRYDILIKKRGFRSFRKKLDLSWKEPQLYIALKAK